MANNTTLRDGNGNAFTAESIDVGSGVQRPSVAANLRINGADASAANPVPTATPTPASIVAGQYKLTASAAAIGTGTLVNGVVIKAADGNAGPVWIGASASLTTTDDGTGSGFRMRPGESLSLAVASLSAIFVVGTSNDIVYYVGN